MWTSEATSGKISPAEGAKSKLLTMKMNTRWSHRMVLLNYGCGGWSFEALSLLPRVICDVVQWRHLVKDIAYPGSWELIMFDVPPPKKSNGQKPWRLYLILVCFTLKKTHIYGNVLWCIWYTYCLLIAFFVQEIDLYFLFDVHFHWDLHFIHLSCITTLQVRVYVFMITSIHVNFKRYTICVFDPFRPIV